MNIIADKKEWDGWESEEDYINYKKDQAFFLRMMGNSCMDFLHEDMPVWSGGEIKNAFREIFNAARESVCINGKTSFIYRDLNHYLEVNVPENDKI